MSTFFDPSNPVIAAVGRGTACEARGDREGARTAYAEAWDAASDDFERCIAAHYVPRLVDDLNEKLRWNEEALAYAKAVDDERVVGFYASLQANVAQCRLLAGDLSGARKAFEDAHASLDDLADDPYREGLRAMIEDGLKAASQ